MKKYSKESYVHDDRNDGPIDAEYMDKSFSYWSNIHQNGLLIKKYSELFYGTVADIGCNFGASSCLLALFENVRKVVGMDIYGRAIEHANAISAHLNTSSKTEFVEIDWTEPSDLFVDFFDCAISFHTLEHIYEEDLNTFIKNTYKCLKKNAKILISIPYEKSFNSPEHVSFFNDNKLKKLMEYSDFNTIECYVHEGTPFTDLTITGLFQKK